MIPIQRFAFLLLLASFGAFAQLGTCPGSKGEPLFTENFGNGTTYGPALPAGTTTYPFVTGAPNDGQYTLYYHSAMYTTWHYSLDHTPDATNGPNGKMLLMNANATTTGDFYRKLVTGLCVNTTFEFSAWVMNVYNPNTNYCGAGQIPINVRFEIWNADETVLLGSGNTGNIMGSPAPLWQQFALVFTTASDTSVVLKMKNNGLGGCGNDLAIDDISFSACGDLTTVSSPSVTGATYTTCANPVSLQLQASTAGGSSYSYQWQSSPDGTTWTDIPSATNPTYATPNLTATTYYRVRAAQDAANLANPYCSTVSNTFTISILAGASPAVSNGDVTICSDEPIPALSVTAAAGTNVNWYGSASGGTLLQANSASFTPTGAGTFYAETYNSITNCVGSPRTQVQLSIVPLPDAHISGSTSICGGNSATITFNGTPNAILTYNVNSGANQTITLNASGQASITQTYSATTVYNLTHCASPTLSGCDKAINETATITVNNTLAASVSSSALVCNAASATVNFAGTPNATVTYTVNSGANQTILLNGSGNASITTPSITAPITYTLVSVSLGGCNAPLNQSITATAVPALAASINAFPLVVCSGQSSLISFMGTPNAIVTYKIGAGANQTITLNASGTASIPASGLTSAVTYTLVSVTSDVLPTCSLAVNGSVTVTVAALPTASIATNAPVCSGSPANVSFTGTPNATVTYTVGGGAGQTIVLNGSGNASVTIASVTSSTVYALLNVTAPGANGCTKTLTQSVTVSSVALPTASISANPAIVCSGQASTIHFSGSANAVVTYSVNAGANQTIALDATGQASVSTNALSANATYALVSISQTGTGCGQSLSGLASVSVNPTPSAIFTGNLVYCEGETIVINLASAVSGTTFNWTVTQNGTSGATAGSGNQISQSAVLQSNQAGTVTYIVTPVSNGCSGAPVNIVVTINPVPVPAIADGVICTRASAPTSIQYYTLDTNLNPATHTFQWFFGPNPIPGAFGSTYNATQVGVYTVIATSNAGCVSDPVGATVSQMPQGESLVIEHSEAFSDHPTVTVTVTGGGGPFMYQLDGLNPQPSNVFHDVSAGTHIITVTDENCTNLTASVTLFDYPKYFTPNGDGFHDTWNITGLEAQIFIFDRYGKLIKQISPDGLGWDGTYNGHELPSTDYWFTIDYTEDAKRKSFNAHFSLKR